MSHAFVEEMTEEGRGGAPRSSEWKTLAATTAFFDGPVEDAA